MVNDSIVLCQLRPKNVQKKSDISCLKVISFVFFLPITNCKKKTEKKKCYKKKMISFHITFVFLLKNCIGNRAKNRQNRENEVSKFAHFAKFDVLEKKSRCTRVFLKIN